MKILIVDDKAENLYMLEALLKGSGYETTLAKNGAEAFGLAKKEMPNLIISDILMPVMDGYTFCIECKKDSVLKDIPFIFYTATYTDPKDENFSLSLGADKFVLKPQEPDVFLEIIDNVLMESKIKENSEKNIQPKPNENNILKEYNATLIRKLEDKMQQSAENERKLKKYVKELEDSLEQRKKAENEIKLLAHAVNSINDCVSITDVENNIVFVNNAFFETYGYTKDELIGKNINILHPQNISNEIGNIILQSTKKGGWQGELENQKKDGTIFPISLSTSEIKDDKGEIVALIGISADITERKLAEKELKESEEKYRIIVETTNDALYRLSYDTMKYEYINPAIIKLTGYTVDEINEIGFRNIVIKTKNLYSSNVSLELVERLRVLGETDEWKADYLIKTKSEELKWLGDHSFPWYNEEGKLIGSIGVLRDITERELAAEETIKAKEKAEEMSRLKSNFLANMSHELRTPLIGILGFSEILQTEIENTEHREMVEDIYTAGKRLSETLNLILDYSDADATKSEMKMVNAVEIVKKSILEVSKLAENKNLYLKLLLEGDEKIFTLLDERLFSGVLNRLIDNAIKFTHKGGITVEVGKKFISQHYWLFVNIKDTGIGIDENNLNFIFDEFRQGSEGFSRNFEGTGLGLAIAKKCVVSMGGKITVESKIEVGSTFIVMLPISENISQNEITEQIDTISVKNENGSKKDLPFLLYVEDDILNRTVIKLLLKGTCNIEIAENGQKALQMAKDKCYDGFLMDINLGRGLDGIEVTKKIKAMSQYINSPIIALTAYAMRSDKDEFLLNGCTHYLAKPFKKKELVNLINEIFK